MLTRRNLVPETWLAGYITEFNGRIAPALKDEAQIKFGGAVVVETANRVATEEEKVGRESGSVAWRAERNELGIMSKTQLSTSKAQLTVKEKVQLLYKQLTQGCSKETCDNVQCKRNAPSRTPNETAVEALRLVQTN